ncbi:hypothetical protein KIPE111705_36750 [Kibdelosporangium persicum]|uniref:DUF6923 family protein n=1 Tax=Kibdelosporangium persicum TaxID=2698649 RepID=UPI0039EEF07C
MRLPSLALTVSFLVASGLVGSAHAADGACEAFEVYTPKHGSMSTLVRLVLPAGSGTELRKFPSQLNAIGYSASQNLLYGVSTRSRVVTLDRGGTAVDRGKVHGIGDATAGAISGSTLFLRDGPKLVSLNIDPASPAYLKVTRTKWLSWLAAVDDWDFGSDAMLYGVTSHGLVVSVDPLSGKVRVLGRPHALPFGTYGAVLMAPGRILYAINNRSNGKSRLYRIPLNALRSASEVASFPPADSTDAAGCLTPPPVAEPPAPPPPPVPPPAPPAYRPRKDPPPSAKPVAALKKPDTEKKRRWAVVTLVLLLGASAAAATVARHR